MDIHQIQKFQYIPVNVRKNNLKCGNYPDEGAVHKLYKRSDR